MEERRHVPEIFGPGGLCFLNCLFLTSQHPRGAAVEERNSQHGGSPLQEVVSASGATVLPSSGRDWAFRVSLGLQESDRAAPPSGPSEVVLSGPGCYGLSRCAAQG